MDEIIYRLYDEETHVFVDFNNAREALMERDGDHGMSTYHGPIEIIQGGEIVGHF